MDIVSFEQLGPDVPPTLMCCKLTDNLEIFHIWMKLIVFIHDNVLP